MATEVILETGTNQDFETAAEALGVIPADAVIPHVIRHLTAEETSGFSTGLLNSNNVKHRWEAGRSVRHNGDTYSGVIISPGASTPTFTTNDWIIQDLLIKVTVDSQNNILANDFAALRTIVRRCVFTSDHPSVATDGARVGVWVRDGGVWFCTYARLTGESPDQNFVIGSGCEAGFCASYVAAGVAIDHMVNLGPAGLPGRLHGFASLAADGGTAAEYTGFKTTSQSFNMGEGEVAPGLSPLDLSDLGFTFAGADDGMFNSSDGSRWGVNKNRPRNPDLLYGGIDVTGFTGFEPVDVRGKLFNVRDLIVGPHQLEAGNQPQQMLTTTLANCNTGPRRHVRRATCRAQQGRR